MHGLTIYHAILQGIIYQGGPVGPHLFRSTPVQIHPGLQEGSKLAEVRGLPGLDPGLEGKGEGVKSSQGERSIKMLDDDD